jgi:hypothetical protein
MDSILFDAMDSVSVLIEQAGSPRHARRNVGTRGTQHQFYRRQATSKVPANGALRGGSR